MEGCVRFWPFKRREPRFRTEPIKQDIIYTYGGKRVGKLSVVIGYRYFFGKKEVFLHGNIPPLKPSEVFYELDHMEPKHIVFTSNRIILKSGEKN